MIYVIFGMSFLFFVLGFILTEGNAKYLLSGYNTMSVEERKKVDIKAFIPFYRNFHIILGLTMLILGMGIFHFIGSDVATLFIAFYPILGYIYFIINSKNYSKGLPQKGTKFAVGLMVGMLILMAGLFYFGFRENHLYIDNNAIRITGIYGETIEKNDIKKLELVSTMPKIKFKMNGFATGNTRKGYFKIKGGEKIKLILNEKSQPLILITKSSGQKLFYTAISKSNTDVFEALKKAFPDKI